jgi:hypothetical protein
MGWWDAFAVLAVLVVFVTPVAFSSTR